MPKYNVLRLERDMASRGWQAIDLARRADVAPSTVSRFLSGDQQTARTAKKLADALGRPLTDYLEELAS